MAFQKKIWKARQGTGLNKFSIDGATPVAIVNQPESVTQSGDAFSMENMNDLELRMSSEFENIELELNGIKNDFYFISGGNADASTI